MAFKYSRGTKFDDRATDVDDSRWDAWDAFGGKEAWYKALQGIVNRQLVGTAGTGGLATVAVGSTAGFKTTNDAFVSINGEVKKCAAKDNVVPSDHTLSANCVAKYLIHTDTAGTDVEVAGPGNIIDKDDYDTVALAEAEVKLPDLPAGCCVLGSVLLHAPTETALAFASDAGFVVGTGGTAGTATYTDLVVMPYDG